jgi:uncharacterized damage-inducible protein DinB
MNDPMLTAAQVVLDLALTEMRGCIEGASPEALNWRPGGDDTNSLAVLAVHSLGSTRSWLSRATGAQPPPRDRDAEFAATATDTEALLALFDEVARDCTALLARPTAVDWGAIVGYIVDSPDGERTWVSEVVARTTRPDSSSSKEVRAAWALLHALEHLREHEGQMSLTRQLWDRRAAG